MGHLVSPRAHGAPFFLSLRADRMRYPVGASGPGETPLPRGDGGAASGRHAAPLVRDVQEFGGPCSWRGSPRRS